MAGILHQLAMAAIINLRMFRNPGTPEKSESSCQNVGVGIFPDKLSFHESALNW